MKQEFKFSVIIPVYNVEEYLAETVESVINQTIGFEQNIQIILVNDGSPDNSEAICEEYQAKYPNNIIYVKQENSGVSAARNNGLNYATGKYINFLDSDDIWEKDVFEVALKMFEENPGLPLIGVRQKYFEARTCYTSLNYKFKKGNRVASMEDEYDLIQLSVTSAFFNKEFIKDIRYDTRIKYSEDAKFIYEVLIKNNKTEYGLIANPLHLYRKRYSQNSAIQTKDLKPDWYFITTELAYDYLLDLAKEKCPELLKCVGYYVAYDYQWRLTTDIENILSKEDKERYLNLTRKIFEKIPDECFLNQKQIDQIDKITLLNLKYNNDYEKVNKVLKENEVFTMFIDIFECDKGKLKIEGYPRIPITNSSEYYIKINNKLKKLKMFDRKYPEKKNCFGYSTSIKGFELQLNADEINKIEFVVSTSNEKVKMNLMFGRFTKLKLLKGSYYVSGKNIMKQKSNTIIIKHNQSILHKLISEIKFLISIRKIKPIIIRVLHSIIPKSKKKIWIFSDRYYVAGDNAEALFKYVNELKNKDIKAYFVIDKTSKDIERLKKYGKVIHYKTLKYMLLFLRADYIVSSHFDKYITNCFGRKQGYYADLFKFKYIFLQHGIIRNDFSLWINKYNTNMDMFVTSVKGEYDSIVNGDYCYDSKVVKLTGLPRYDNLYRNNESPKKQILMIPTWRAYLMGAYIDGTRRMYNDKFKDSYFYKMYNSLMNDERIHEALKTYGYKIKFCLHPMLAAQIKDFKSNEYVEICKGNINYQQEFKENKIMVTDYSSVSCDFAYLHKPVIYIRGDKEEFFANHTCTEGYFDEEKNGFGPVAYDYEQAVNLIINAIKTDGKLEKKYEQNINKFFKFNDDNNCKRVYNEILKIKK